MPPEKIPQALKVLDVDNDGKISLPDMRDAVIQVHVLQTPHHSQCRLLAYNHWPHADTALFLVHEFAATIGHACTAWRDTCDLEALTDRLWHSGKMIILLHLKT